MATFKYIKYFILNSVLLCNSVFALEYTFYVTGNAASGSTYTQTGGIGGQCVGMTPSKYLVINCTSNAQGIINVFGTITVSPTCHYTLDAMSGKFNGIYGNCAGIVETDDIPPIPDPGNAKWKIELNTTSSANTPK